MDWLWTTFNFACGIAGLVGLWLAIRAESRAKSVEREVRDVVRKNRRILLTQEISAAAAEGKLFLGTRSRPTRMVHLNRLREGLAEVQASRELSDGERKALQRLSIDLRRIVVVTPAAGAAVREAVEHIAGLRRRLIEQVTDE